MKRKQAVFVQRPSQEDQPMMPNRLVIQGVANMVWYAEYCGEVVSQFSKNLLHKMITQNTTPNVTSRDILRRCVFATPCRVATNRRHVGNCYMTESVV